MVDHRCVVLLERNILAHVPQGDKAAVASDLKAIFRVHRRETAELLAKEFAQRYGISPSHNNRYIIKRSSMPNHLDVAAAPSEAGEIVDELQHEIPPERVDLRLLNIVARIRVVDP